MEQNDFERQVWQRVRACPEEPRSSGLEVLRREAAELAAVYARLQGQLSGKAREQVVRLQSGEQANAAALAGLARLSRQTGERIKLWQPGKEDPGKALPRCYHRTRRCMTEYMARSADPEFGVVFEKLAKREAEHCTLIAELLGEIK